MNSLHDRRRAHLVAADDVEIVDRRHRQAERRDQHAPGKQRAGRHGIAERHAMAVHRRLGRHARVAEMMAAAALEIERIGGGQPGVPFAAVIAMQDDMVGEVAHACGSAGC